MTLIWILIYIRRLEFTETDVTSESLKLLIFSGSIFSKIYISSRMQASHDGSPRSENPYATRTWSTLWTHSTGLLTILFSTNLSSVLLLGFHRIQKTPNLTGQLYCYLMVIHTFLWLDTYLENWFGPESVSLSPETTELNSVACVCALGDTRTHAVCVCVRVCGEWHKKTCRPHKIQHNKWGQRRSLTKMGKETKFDEIGERDEVWRNWGKRRSLRKLRTWNRC